MKSANFLAVLIAGSFWAVSRANAEAVKYDGNGIYTADAPTTDFTAPNEPFSFEFTVPQTVPQSNPQPGPLFVETSILSGSFTFEGRTIPATSGFYQFSNSAGNRTDIVLDAPTLTIDITGPEGVLGLIFDLNADRTEAIFRTGEVGVGGPGPVNFSSNGANVTAPAEYGNLVGTAVPVPESPSFVLVALGASLATPLLIRRQKLIA